jgi:hypothetical protein
LRIVSTSAASIVIVAEVTFASVAFITLEMDFIKNGDASFLISYVFDLDRRITVFPMRIGSNAIELLC